MFLFVGLGVGAALLTSVGLGSPRIFGLGLAALASWAMIELASMGAADRRPRLALVLLMLLNLGFWLAFGRLGRVLLALVDAGGGLFGASPASLRRG